MTGSRVQLYNGIALLTTFFVCRVLWGNYQSICIYSDVWTALHTPRFYPQIVKDNSIFAYPNIPGSRSNSEYGFGKMGLPMWLVYAYLGSNTILNFLNIYWFAKMIQALRKRFQHSNLSIKKERNSEVDIGQHVD
jgi:TLC domain